MLDDDTKGISLFIGKKVKMAHLLKRKKRHIQQFFTQQMQLSSLAATIWAIFLAIAYLSLECGLLFTMGELVSIFFFLCVRIQGNNTKPGDVLHNIRISNVTVA